MTKIKSNFFKLCLLMQLFTACNLNPSMNFEVINNSQDKITQVKISASGSREIETNSLIDNKILKYELKMTDLPKKDGGYNIEFRRDGIIETKSFGYYTNGYPSDENYKIIILDQGVEIKINSGNKNKFER